MADELLRSKHAFGSVKNLDTAIEAGKVDAFDILFLTDDDGNAKIGWLNKQGQKVILEDKKQVLTLQELPSSGETDALYVVGTKLYVWDGEKFTAVSGADGVTEDTVDAKITTAKDEIKAYADEQIANAVTVVEF